jgi:putative membrane protein
MPMYWNGGTGWGDWIAMSLVMIAFWGLLLTAVFVVVRATARRGGGRGAERFGDDRTPGPSRASAILEERFAQGEITAEELAASRRVLAGSPGVT